MRIEPGTKVVVGALWVFTALAIIPMPYIPRLIRWVVLPALFFAGCLLLGSGLAGMGKRREKPKC